MRIVLADLASADGFVSKDTVVGRVRIAAQTVLPSHARRLGDEETAAWTCPACSWATSPRSVPARGTRSSTPTDASVDGDVAHRADVARRLPARSGWAAAQRRRGLRVGFVGLDGLEAARSCSSSTRDFVVIGEPEPAIHGSATGEHAEGVSRVAPVDDLDHAPISAMGHRAGGRSGSGWSLPFSDAPIGGAYPLLASRGCPEFCTYCPHRILASHRAPQPSNIADEIEYLTTHRSRNRTSSSGIRCSPTIGSGASRCVTRFVREA